MFKNTLFLFYTLLFSTLNFSCENNDKENIPFLTLSPQRKIYTYKDSLYFRNVTEINFYDSRYYIADYSNNRILILDSLLNYIVSIGGYGQGPGEFRGVKHIGVSRDTIYAVDDGNMRVNVFSVSGKYIRGFPLQDRYYTVCKYAVDETGNFYFSSPTGLKRIAKYDIHDRKLLEFGDFVPANNQNFRRENQISHILYYDKKIYTVMHTNPILDIYDMSGKELGRFKMPMRLFKSRIDYTEKEYRRDPANMLKTYKLFQDSFIQNGKLYLLYITNDDVKGALCNQILVVDFNGVVPYPEKVIKLNGLWYTSFAVSGNKLVAFNSTEASIESYLLHDEM